MIILDRPVLKAGEVAELFGWTITHFYTQRPKLEREGGFPPRLPGVAGWSRAAVLRWIDTNGATHLPAPVGVNELEARYAS